MTVQRVVISRPFPHPSSMQLRYLLIVLPCVVASFTTPVSQRRSSHEGEAQANGIWPKRCVRDSEQSQKSRLNMA
jgi:hypothetical protein